MIQKDYFFKKTVEDSVKEHICLNAPVLMGLKPAAIFTVTKAEKEILEEIFSKDSDLFIETLHSGTKDSILLYRKALMERQLAQKDKALSLFVKARIPGGREQLMSLQRAF